MPSNAPVQVVTQVIIPGYDKLTDEQKAMLFEDLKTTPVRKMTTNERAIYSRAVSRAVLLVPAFRDAIALMRPYMDASAPTAYTDKYARVAFGYWWFYALSSTEQASVLLHECMHVLNNHFHRWGEIKGVSNNPNIFNLAGDFEINTTLDRIELVSLKAGQFPDKAPHSFPPGKTMEIYAHLLMEQQKEKEDNCPVHGKEAQKKAKEEAEKKASADRAETDKADADKNSEESDETDAESKEESKEKGEEKSSESSEDSEDSTDDESDESSEGQDAGDGEESDAESDSGDAEGSQKSDDSEDAGSQGSDRDEESGAESDSGDGGESQESNSSEGADGNGSGKGAECNCGKDHAEQGDGQGQGQGQGSSQGQGSEDSDSWTCGNSDEKTEIAADEAGVQRASDVEQTIAKKNTAARIIEQRNREHREGRGYGAGNSWFDAVLAHLMPPVVDWRKIFRRVVAGTTDSLAKGRADYTYRRTSRRLQDPHFVFPGMVTYNPKVMLGIDTSGSMGTEDFQTSLNEIESLLKEVSRGKTPVTVFAVDTQIGNVQPVTSVKKINLSGGGGTIMAAAWQYIKTLSRLAQPDIFVLATDGGIDWDDVEEEVRTSKFKSVILVTQESGFAAAPESLKKIIPVLDISKKDK